MEKNLIPKRERIRSAWRTENLQRLGFRPVEIQGIQAFLTATTTAPANFLAQFELIKSSYASEEEVRAIGEMLLANPKVVEFIYSMANAYHRLHVEEKVNIDQQTVRYIVSVVFQLSEENFSYHKKG